MMKSVSALLILASAVVAPLQAQEWNRKRVPQHVLQQQGGSCQLTEENMLRRNQEISSYAEGAFVVDKDSRGNGEAFFLRHPIRVALLTNYEIRGRITVDKMEGEPRIFRVELLDTNREEFAVREFSLPAVPVPGEPVEFRFPFRTLRGTPFIRTWIGTDSKTLARFRIDDLEVVQTGAPRGRETAPLAAKASGDAAVVDFETLPEGVEYLRVALQTTGRPAEGAAPLRIEILGEGDRQLAVYELRWETMPGLRPEWDRIAGTWFEPTRSALAEMGFSRHHHAPGGGGGGQGPPVLRWEEELSVPAGARRLSVVGPADVDFRVADITVALHAEADDS